MTGMEDVLAAHWSASTHTESKPFVDKCDGCGAVIFSWGDVTVTNGADRLAKHQAEALSAAGFGNLHDAWDAGYTVGNAHNGRRDANPYPPKVSEP